MALRICEKNHFHQDSPTNLTLLLVLLPFPSCNISTNHVFTTGESPAPQVGNNSNTHAVKPTPQHVEVLKCKISRNNHVAYMSILVCFTMLCKTTKPKRDRAHHQPFQPPPSIGTKSSTSPFHKGRSCLIERTIMTTIHMHGVARLWPSIFQHANQRAFDPLVGLGL